MDIKLKYGCNPNQKFARVSSDVEPSPLTIRNGSPSYINLLDALRGWQLVRELNTSVGKAAAASFKHVSPAGAAVAGALSDDFLQAHFYQVTDPSPVTTAYAKARSSDRVASFGDFVAVSERVDLSLAQLLKSEVSDGIIAPGYDDDAAQLLASKKGGGYVMFQIDPDYQPPAVESRTEFGLTLEQSYNDSTIDRTLLQNVVTKRKQMTEQAAETLMVTTITLKHTQSNSMAMGYAGHAIGIGAGQQSRIACTRLACDKADRWFLKLHTKARGLKFKPGVAKPDKVNAIDGFVRWHELDGRERAGIEKIVEGRIEPLDETERTQWTKQFDGVVLSSDAFLPFRDNVDRAARSGAKYVIQAGGSKRDQDVITAADEYEMVMVMSGLRLFLH